MSLASRLYATLPVPLQHAAVTCYGGYWYWARHTGSYSTHLSEFAHRSAYSEAQWAEWRMRALRRALRNALDVPYYSETWTPAERRSAAAGDLGGLPLLEKSAVRRAPRDFVRRGKRPLTIETHTSGSSGTPLLVLSTLDELRASRAVREVRSAGWAGVSFKQPRATFSGRMAVPDPSATKHLYRFNAIERQVYFSPFHLGADTAADYVAALNRHEILWLTGYAVSFNLLAKHMLGQGLKTPTVKAAVTTSEKLTPAMRDTIGRAFGCRVFEEYGTAEQAVLATECPAGRLHVSPDVSHVEILRPDGTHCEPGEPGEVVITTLLRQYQPLVRFRLGDVASWGRTGCGCGSALPVLEEVCGRLEDVVVGPDGREMVRFHGVFVSLPHVIEGQVVQHALDHIELRVVTEAEFGASDERTLADRVRERLGAVRVTVTRCDALPRAASGKLQAVVSHLTRQ